MRKMRICKRKPKNVGPFEIPIRFNLIVNIPERVELEVKGEVDIPEYKVNEMVLESI